MHTCIHTYANPKTFPTYVAKKGNKNAYVQVPPITLCLLAPPIRSKFHINDHSQASEKHSLISVNYNLFTESGPSCLEDYYYKVQSIQGHDSIVGYLEGHKGLTLQFCNTVVDWNLDD